MSRPAITAIEIPIIQRDFAQGRPDDEASAIRERFLDAIVRAATTDAEMGLDFVYGDVKAGVLRPLDGQQRLTTLFLLHWYVASLRRRPRPAAPWLRFSYATRPTARDFCRTLAEHPYPADAATRPAWITDQPWYVYPWRHDPTISSMLVMLDAIHERLRPRADRLRRGLGPALGADSDEQRRRIWFLFLPVADMDYGEDLYIKMNSRGKPLTAFEVFKADLESELIDQCCRPQSATSTSRRASTAPGPTSSGSTRRPTAATSSSTTSSCAISPSSSTSASGATGSPTAGVTRQPRGSGRSKNAPGSPSPTPTTNTPRNRDFFFHAFDTWVGPDPRAPIGNCSPRARGGGRSRSSRHPRPLWRPHRQVRSGVLGTGDPAPPRCPARAAGGRQYVRTDC